MNIKCKIKCDECSDNDNIKLNSNDNTAESLNQIRNNKLSNNPKGNTGKDLFYYQIELSPFNAIRDDFLSQDCRFRSDPADYHADLIMKIVIYISESPKVIILYLKIKTLF